MVLPELVSAIPGRLIVEVAVELIVLGVHVAVMYAILRTERRQPSATLAWLLAVALLPFVGLGLYFLIGQTRSRRIRKRSRRTARRVAEIVDACPACRVAPADEEGLEPRTRAALRLGEKLTGAPASRGNAVEILEGAAATYRSMLAAFASATRQIHVGFYIIQPDTTGASLRDRLAARAAQGVQVRVLADAVGSSTLDADFWAPLAAAGGRHAVFHPVSVLTTALRRRDRVDFRNHRKLVIVDGRVGFTGGINVGREYLGLDLTFGDWRDTHMRIEGPAALGLQQVFALDWLSASGEEPEASWFPPPVAHAQDALVHVVDSGPDTELSPVEQLVLHAIGSAQRRAWLTTPYFVPSPAISSALVNAALRGVDVRLLMPDRPDHLVVALASRSYFPEMLRAGVRVFLYRRGFLHAKTIVVDSWMGTIGSANMDMRSFRLNFELNAFVYERRFTDALAQQFLLDLDHAREHTREDERRMAPLRKLARQSARLLSPLL